LFPERGETNMGLRESVPRKILVVDDDQIIAITMSAILRDEGYEVATAFSGEEAVEKAKAFSPDLLLSDIWMDSMNGVEAASRIATKLPSLKILFVSGDATMLDVLNVFPKRIVYSLMLKPARVPDLLNAIAYMLPTIEAPTSEVTLDSMHMTTYLPKYQDQITRQFHDCGMKFPVRSVDLGDHDLNEGRRVSGFPAS
jgi:CheY-like chemotaxis protein